MTAKKNDIPSATQ